MGKYDDIIHLPHHVSPVRPRMPREARAAQFAPFAALTGLDETLDETARLTDSRLDITPERAELLSRRLAHLLAAGPGATASLTYFLPDGRKEGGRYVTVEGGLRRIDEVAGQLVLTDGTVIALADIIDIDGIPTATVSTQDTLSTETAH